MDSRVISRMDIEFYLEITKWPLLQSLYRIQVLRACQKALAVADVAAPRYRNWDYGALQHEVGVPQELGSRFFWAAVKR